MAIAPGTRLGALEIVGRIGAGAMGEVYRARDTRLHRDVAVKVLAGDAIGGDRIARFEREAQTLASLNHPNIAQIYGLEDAPGSTPGKPARAIVMELVEGEDLSDRIDGGALPVSDVVAIAGQIAGAISAAHDAGIVHRDLKPSNIRIRRDGVVKILDFGLAKPDATAAAVSSASTVAGFETAHDVLVGTPAYMSPEQARGHGADARSDIWAFGCVVYEMLSGRRPFSGVTIADTLVKILEREPDWDALPASTPPGLRRLLRRCLVKDPTRRLNALADARFDLDDVDEESVSASGGRATASRLRRPVAAALVTFAALTAGAMLWRARPSSPPFGPEQVLALTTYPGMEAQPTFSPDGKLVAFSWDGERHDNEDIYVTIVGADPPHRLTENPARDVSPAWKPDASQIAFARLDESGTSIYVAAALGGAEQRLAEFPPPGTSTAPRGTADPFLSWSPDGRWLAVSRLSIDKPSPVELVAHDGSQRRTLLAATPGQDYTAAAFSPRGDVLAYAESGFLGIVEVDPANPSVVRRPPRRVSDFLGYVAGLTWSADGKEIVYGRAAYASPTAPFLWRVAANGASPPRRIELAGVASFPAVSTSGRLAFSRRDLNVDMFVLTGSSQPRRLAASTYNEFDAAFSADGSKVAFATDRTGDGNEIWVVNSDGSGRRPLTRGTRKPEGSPRWSPDGTRLAFDGVGDDGQRHVFVIDQAGGAVRAIPGRPGHFDQVPSWSRDGKWLYFGSNRSGESEIWRVAADGSGARQMTSKGGGVPFESPDGRTLYYSKPVPGGRRVFARPVEGGEERSLGVDVVFWNYFVGAGGLYYATLPEGRRAPFSYELRLLDGSGRTTVLQRLQLSSMSPGLGVSPDGKSLLIAGVTEIGQDLFRIDNFR